MDACMVINFCPHTQNRIVGRKYARSYLIRYGSRSFTALRGHSSSQHPQYQHSSYLTYAFPPSSNLRASMGHISTHTPHPSHLSLSISTLIGSPHYPAVIFRFTGLVSTVISPVSGSILTSTCLSQFSSSLLGKSDL